MHIVCKGNGQNNTKDEVEIYAFSFTNFACERSLQEAGAGQFVDLSIHSKLIWPL